MVVPWFWQIMEFGMPVSSWESEEDKPNKKPPSNKKKIKKVWGIECKARKSTWSFLFHKDWGIWKTYKSKKARDEALRILIKNQSSHYEFRAVDYGKE
jgi:hypothetical protein